MKSESDLHGHTQPIPTPTLHIHPITLVAAMTSIFVGLAVLVGWVFEVTVLKSVLPDLASMKASSAVSFILLGSALWLSIAGKPGRPLAIMGRVAALAAALIAAASLLDFATGADIGIDDLMFTNHQTESLGTVVSSQMSLATSAR